MIYLAKNTCKFRCRHVRVFSNLVFLFSNGSVTKLIIPTSVWVKQKKPFSYFAMSYTKMIVITTIVVYPQQTNVIIMVMQKKKNLIELKDFIKKMNILLKNVFLYVDNIIITFKQIFVEQNKNHICRNINFKFYGVIKNIKQMNTIISFVFLHIY